MRRLAACIAVFSLLENIVFAEESRRNTRYITYVGRLPSTVYPPKPPLPLDYYLRAGQNQQQSAVPSNLYRDNNNNVYNQRDGTQYQSQFLSSNSPSNTNSESTFLPGGQNRQQTQISNYGGNTWSHPGYSHVYSSGPDQKQILKYINSNEPSTEIYLDDSWYENPKKISTYGRDSSKSRNSHNKELIYAKPEVTELKKDVFDLYDSYNSYNDRYYSPKHGDSYGKAVYTETVPVSKINVFPQNYLSPANVYNIKQTSDYPVLYRSEPKSHYIYEEGNYKPTGTSEIIEEHQYEDTSAVDLRDSLSKATVIHEVDESEERKAETICICGKKIENYHSIHDKSVEIEEEKEELYEKEEEIETRLDLLSQEIKDEVKLKLINITTIKDERLEEKEEEVLFESKNSYELNSNNRKAYEDSRYSHFIDADAKAEEIHHQHKESDYNIYDSVHKSQYEDVKEIWESMEKIKNAEQDRSVVYYDEQSKIEKETEERSTYVGVKYDDRLEIEDVQRDIIVTDEIKIPHGEGFKVYKSPSLINEEILKRYQTEYYDEIERSSKEKYEDTFVSSSERISYYKDSETYDSEYDVSSRTDYSREVEYDVQPLILKEITEYGEIELLDEASVEEIEAEEKVLTEQNTYLNYNSKEKISSEVTVVKSEEKISEYSQEIDDNFSQITYKDSEVIESYRPQISDAYNNQHYYSSIEKAERYEEEDLLKKEIVEKDFIIPEHEQQKIYKMEIEKLVPTYGYDRINKFYPLTVKEEDFASSEILSEVHVPLLQNGRYPSPPVQNIHLKTETIISEPFSNNQNYNKQRVLLPDYKHQSPKYTVSPYLWPFGRHCSKHPVSTIADTSRTATYYKHSGLEEATRAFDYTDGYYNELDGISSNSFEIKGETIHLEEDIVSSDIKVADNIGKYQEIYSSFPYDTAKSWRNVPYYNYRQSYLPQHSAYHRIVGPTFFPYQTTGSAYY